MQCSDIAECSVGKHFIAVNSHRTLRTDHLRKIVAHRPFFLGEPCGRRLLACLRGELEETCFSFIKACTPQRVWPNKQIMECCAVRAGVQYYVQYNDIAEWSAQCREVD